MEVAKIAVQVKNRQAIFMIRQVALEDLILGAPGSKRLNTTLGDLIIVTGVGNNSPGLVRAPK